MRAKQDNIGKTGLQFYGKITASISHEIKNVLAIINENAGLLEDLTALADRGKPLDPARLKTMAAAVQKQIGRADEILNNMNRFAHSIDQTVAEIDLNQTIELLMALTDRFAAMRGVKVVLQLPQNPLTITTAPFLLMNLLWLCLEDSMSAAGDEKWIELVADESQNGFRIRFRRLAGLSETISQTFPSDREKNLLNLLAADLTKNPQGQEIVLRLFKNIGEI